MRDAITRDERTMTVENESYRWGYLLLSFGMLLIVAYRGLVRQEPGWDMLALVIAGGVVTTSYQSAHKILSQRWVLTAALTALFAAILAAGIAFLR